MTESELADPGVTVAGSGFAPESEVSLTVAAAAAGSATTDADGEVSFTYASASLAPGTHPVVLSAAVGTAEASLVVEADPVVYDPQVMLDPSELTESEIASSGVTATGSGFAPASEVTLTVDGADIETAVADADGGVEFTYVDDVPPGEYGLALSSQHGSAATSFTVTEDPVTYEPEVNVSPSTVTESELADPGVTVSGSGFAPESEVTLAVDGAEVESAAADGDGSVGFTYAASLVPGEYAVALTSEDGSATAALVVEADAVVYDPRATVVPEQLTESEVASSGVSVTGTGFAPESEVTLAVDGAEAESAEADGDGAVEFTYAAVLAPGEYPVVLSAAEGTASAAFTVVADPVVYDPQATVVPEQLTESEVASSGVSVTGTEFAPESEVRFTVDGADIESTEADVDGAVEFTYTAVLAPGEYGVALTSDDGSATAAFTVVEDPVVGDPQITVAPSELTESEIASSGVTVTGAGFAPASEVTLTVDGTDIESAAADDDGRVEFSYASALAPGEYPVVLSAAEDTASAAFTVVPDPVVYDPQVELDPREVTVSELATPGVAVVGSGFAPGSAVDLQVADEADMDGVADADGVVTFQLVIADADPGAYTVTLTADEGTAQATLTVIADADPDPQIPADTPTEDALTPQTQGGITVPPTADEAATITAEIGVDRAGERIGVWIFSDPHYLGTQVVGDDGAVQLELPEGVTGAHRVAAFAEDESVIGWDDIEITAGPDGSDDGSDAGSDDGSGTGSDGGSHSGSEDGDTSGSADGDASGSEDGATTGSGGDHSGGTTDGDGDELPDTGAASMSAALGALALLALGAALVIVRNRSQMS